MTDEKSCDMTCVFATMHPIDGEGVLCKASSYYLVTHVGHCKKLHPEVKNEQAEI